MLIVPGILLVLIGLFIFFVLDDSSGDNWWIAVLFIGFGCAGVYASSAARLITSAEGIQNYYFFQFHVDIQWEEIKEIYITERGDVNLLHTKKGAVENVPLSSYVEDWQNNELIKDIQTYAPRLIIPDRILLTPKIKTWHRPGTMMIYYVLCMVFATITLAPLALPFFAPVKNSVIQACWGFVLGTFGGMLALQGYTPWMNRNWRNQRIDEIGKVARWQYVLPFSGWAITLVFGVIAQSLSFELEHPSSNDERLLKLIIISIPILQTFFLPYMRNNRKR